MSTSALAPAAQDEIATLFVDAAGYRRHRHPYRPSARRAAASPVAASRTARSPHSIAADNFSFVRELILLGQGVGLLPASLCESRLCSRRRRCGSPQQFSGTSRSAAQGPRAADSPLEGAGFEPSVPYGLSIASEQDAELWALRVAVSLVRLR